MDATTEIPEVRDVDMAWGHADEHLPEWSSLPDEFQQMNASECTAAAALFFEGGKLSDHGIELRDDIDHVRAHRLIRALLGSFGSKHEHKIGGVGFLLRQWRKPA